MQYQSKQNRNHLSFPLLFRLTKKSVAMMAQTIPVTKKTPVKPSAEKIGLNIIGGKNRLTKRNVVRIDIILPRVQVFVSSPTQRFSMGTPLTYSNNTKATITIITLIAWGIRMKPTVYRPSSITAMTNKCNLTA